MDHRRLAEVLVKVFPSDYIIYQPEALQKEINDFLANLYLLTSDDYNTLLQSFDEISNVSFWGSFKIKYEEHLKNPLFIFPYMHTEKPEEIRWADSNCLDSLYTPEEQ